MSEIAKFFAEVTGNIAGLRADRHDPIPRRDAGPGGRTVRPDPGHAHAALGGSVLRRRGSGARGNGGPEAF